MKLAHLLTLAALAMPSAGQTPAPTCDGVAPPAPLLDVVLEPNAPRYSGTCLEGEACELPTGWDTREFLPDGSARYVFAYVGELKVSADWKTTTELKIRPAPAPACWAMQWGPVK